MINICLCDDSEPIRKNYAKVINHYFPEKIQLYEFESGEKLLEFVQNTQIELLDIIIMDIRMKQLNGIKSIEQLRSWGYRGEVIYLTSEEASVFDSFMTEPLNYILKDKKNTKIFLITLKEAIELAKHKRSKCIMIQRKDKREAIQHSSIMYIESNLRKVIFRLDTEEIIECYVKLNDVLEKLKDESFAQVQKSFVVNLGFVKSMKGNNITLVDGREMALGRSYAYNFKKRFSEILIARME